MKTLYYLETLTLEKMQLLGNAKNGANKPFLETTEVVLIHCNIINNNYQKNSRLSLTRCF